MNKILRHWRLRMVTMRHWSLTKLVKFLALLGSSTFILTSLIYSVISNSVLEEGFSDTDQRSLYSWLWTRNMSAYVKPDQVTTLILPTNIGHSARPRLLVMVMSAPSRQDRREAIRQTWGSRLKSNPDTALIFFLGQSKDNQILRSVQEESNLTGDIVMEDFYESYVNLTIKSTFMLKWLQCQQIDPKGVKPQFILKADDDIFLNPTNLLQDIASFQSPYLMMGFAASGLPNRNANHKWFLSYEFYKASVLPRFLSGSPGYLFHSNLIPKLLSCALSTPYLNLEDVFLTGICASEQMGLNLIHNPNFYKRMPLVDPHHICYFQTSSMLHPVGIKELTSKWNEIDQTSLNCDNNLWFSMVKAISNGLERAGANVCQTMYGVDECL